MFTCENQWNAASRAAGEIFQKSWKNQGNRLLFPNQQPKIGTDLPIHIQFNFTTRQSRTQEFIRRF